MIVRFEIDAEGEDLANFGYRVSFEAQELFSDAGLQSVEQCIVAAIEGLGQDAVGAEIWYRGFVSGTYPLASLALMSAQIAEHAVNTASAFDELLR